MPTVHYRMELEQVFSEPERAILLTLFTQFNAMCTALDLPLRTFTQFRQDVRQAFATVRRESRKSPARNQEG